MHEQQQFCYINWMNWKIRITDKALNTLHKEIFKNPIMMDFLVLSASPSGSFIDPLSLHLLTLNVSY